MIYVPAEVMPASVFAALHSTAPGQSSTPYSFGWIASPATRDCLSCHWISWRLLLPKPMLNDYSRCVVIWWQENGTVLRCPCVGGVFLKLNRHILHWTQYTENWSVTCYWYCRTAEDTLQRLRFWLLPTYLLSVVIRRTTLTYKNVNKTKTKIPPKLKLQLKWYLKLKKTLVGSHWAL